MATSHITTTRRATFSNTLMLLTALIVLPLSGCATSMARTVSGLGDGPGKKVPLSTYAATIPFDIVTSPVQVPMFVVGGGLAALDAVQAEAREQAYQAQQAKQQEIENQANAAVANPEAMRQIIAKVGQSELAPWEQLALIRYCYQKDTIPAGEVRKLLDYYANDLTRLHVVVTYQAVTEDDFHYLLTKANAEVRSSGLWRMLDEHPRTPPGVINIKLSGKCQCGLEEVLLCS